MSSIEQDVYEMLVTYIVENQDKFYRLAFSYAHNQEDALDIVQNAVCKALENYQNLNNQRAIRTWMYRIVVNESLQLLKAREREVLSGEDGKWIALEDVLGKVMQRWQLSRCGSRRRHLRQRRELLMIWSSGRASRQILRSI